MGGDCSVAQRGDQQGDGGEDPGFRKSEAHRQSHGEYFADPPPIRGL